MTIAELWEYCVANDLTERDIEIPVNQFFWIKVDNVSHHDDKSIYLEGEL